MFARQEFPLFPAPRDAADGDGGSAVGPGGPAGGDTTADVGRASSAGGGLVPKPVRPRTRQYSPSRPPGGTKSPSGLVSGCSDTGSTHHRSGEEAGVTVPETAADAPSGLVAAAWTAEEVAAELRDASLVLAAASVLLERTGDGGMHPQLRRARRCSQEALDLAASVERLVGGGLSRLRDRIGGADTASIGRVVGSLTVSRNQFTTAAEQIALLPGRLRTAVQQLHGHDGDGLERDVEQVGRDWARAIEHLGLLGDSLAEAAASLGSYTDQLMGAPNH